MRISSLLFKPGCGFSAIAVALALLFTGCQQNRLSVSMATCRTITIVKGDMASDEGGPPQASVNELVSILHEGLAAKGYTVVDNEGKADLTMTLSYHGGAAASQPVQASTDKVAGASFILSLKDGTQKRIWTATIAAESAQVLARDALNEIPVKTKEN